MKTTFEDLLHAINLLGEERSVRFDGVASIDICPPFRLSPTGRRQFETALRAIVLTAYDFEAGGNYEGTIVTGNDDEVQAAMDMILRFNGYCAGGNYKLWFENDAKVI